MKILWAKTDFLHPTTRGGQIRTLEMLRRLARRHEIHYAAFLSGEDADAESLERSPEYCARAYPVAHRLAAKLTARFAAEAAANVFASLPLAVARYRNQAMRRLLTELAAAHRFDALVCDFIAAGVNIEDLSRWVIFQHNVETMIWRRHAETAADPLRRYYFRQQARRMFDYEGSLCRRARHVVAVSETDARLLERTFGLERVSWVPTGVDVEHFARPAAAGQAGGLVFVGSMDWMANIDGVKWFVSEVLPLIRRRKPDCTLALVGRNPAPSVRKLAEQDSRIQVPGTVPDVRPYLWGSAVSIVPLRIGSGTRLKIYEAMAAGTAVVSTPVGAEGLPLTHGENVLLAETAQDFADCCVELLDDPCKRARIAQQALALVRSRFSWETAAREFENILAAARL